MGFDLLFAKVGLKFKSFALAIRLFTHPDFASRNGFISLSFEEGRGEAITIPV